MTQTSSRYFHQTVGVHHTNIESHNHKNQLKFWKTMGFIPPRRNLCRVYQRFLWQWRLLQQEEKAERRMRRCKCWFLEVPLVSPPMNLCFCDNYHPTVVADNSVKMGKSATVLKSEDGGGRRRLSCGWVWNSPWPLSTPHQWLKLGGQFIVLRVFSIVHKRPLQY